MYQVDTSQSISWITTHLIGLYDLLITSPEPPIFGCTIYSATCFSYILAIHLTATCDTALSGYKDGGLLILEIIWSLYCTCGLFGVSDIDLSYEVCIVPALCGCRSQTHKSPVLITGWLLVLLPLHTGPSYYGFPTAGQLHKVVGGGEGLLELVAAPFAQV